MTLTRERQSAGKFFLEKERCVCVWGREEGHREGQGDTGQGLSHRKTVDISDWSRQIQTRLWASY